MRRRKGTEGARHERGALLQAEPLVHAEAEALIREHRAEAYGEARQRELPTGQHMPAQTAAH
jgi:hypothetical protein